MSYQEKRIVMSIFTGAAVLASYCIYAAVKYRSGALSPEDYRAWAVVMLTFIGIGIIAAIISQIVFHIFLSIGIAVRETIKDSKTDEKEIEKNISREMVEDERDKLISMKSQQVVFIFTGIGFVLSLISIVLNYSPVVMMHIIFGFFSVGSMIEGFIQLYFYRTGITNG